jgi:hypothetical protein
MGNQSSSSRQSLHTGRRRGESKDKGSAGDDKSDANKGPPPKPNYFETSRNVNDLLAPIVEKFGVPAMVSTCGRLRSFLLTHKYWHYRALPSSKAGRWWPMPRVASANVSLALLQALLCLWRPQTCGTWEGARKPCECRRAGLMYSIAYERNGLVVCCLAQPLSTWVFWMQYCDRHSCDGGDGPAEMGDHRS